MHKLRGFGSKESVEHVLFESVHHVIPQRMLFWDNSKQLLTPGAFEGFLCGSIFDTAVFYSGEKHGRPGNK